MKKQCYFPSKTHIQFFSFIKAIQLFKKKNFPGAFGSTLIEINPDIYHI